MKAVKTSRGITVTADDALLVLDGAVKRAVERLKTRVGADLHHFASDIIDNFGRKVVQHVVQVAQDYKNDQKPKDLTIMPVGTRLCYQCRKNLILLVEQPPQTRVIKALRSTPTYTFNPPQRKKGIDDIVDTYSLALPYVVFLFGFQEGFPLTFQVAMRTSPLTSEGDHIYHFILPNVHSHEICMGQIKTSGNSVAQYAHNLITNFWAGVFGQDYNSELIRATQADSRISSFSTWESCTQRDPTFILQNKSGPYGKTYSESTTVAEWVNRARYILGAADVEGDKEFVITMKKWLRGELDGLTSQFTNKIGSISVSVDQHHNPEQVETLQLFLEQFLDQATVELRHLYEEQLAKQVRKLDERISRHAAEVLSSENYAQPW